MKVLHIARALSWQSTIADSNFRVWRVIYMYVRCSRTSLLLTALTCVGPGCVYRTGFSTECASRGSPECAASELCLTPGVEAKDGGLCCPLGDCLSADREYTEAQVASGIVVDGDPTDWGGVPRVHIAKVIAGVGPPPPSTADFDSYFATLWDTTGLYVLVESNDDVMPPPDRVANVPYQDDAIEVFVDMDLRNPQEAYSADNSENQMFATSDNVVTELVAHPRGWTAQSMYSATATQRWFEFKLDWPTRFGPPACGDIVGFDVGSDDDDAEGDVDRETQLFWNDASGLLCCDARHFGLLRLTCP
jgi:hypothetical protein